MTGSAAAYQVELLRSDIEDVHSVILDVLSRVGPLHQTSWKYPDRNGYELDVAELLRKYKLSDDENEELIMQTALLELLIDRFLLLLHALSSFVDQRSHCPPSSERESKMNLKSAGLTARQYWRKIGSLLSFVNDLQKELAAKDAKIAQLESSMSQKIDATKLRQSVAVSLPQIDKKVDFAQEAKQRKADIAAETCIRGTQTLETAFRPCESCAVVQDGLRSVLDCVSSLVVNQNVPSSVAKFKKCYDGVPWLSATDLQRLVPELSCDLDKIQRQWVWLFSQLDPLRQEIDKLNKELDSTKQELQRKKSDLSCIQNIHTNAFKDAEAKWSSADREAQLRINDLRQRNDKLLADKELLLDQVHSLQSVVDEKQRLLEEFQRLQSNLDGLSAESQVINEHLVSVTSERDSLRTALLATKEELNRSTMMAESMRARCETLQAKQDSLLEQMSLMDRSTDDYRIKVSNLEGQLDAIRDHLEDKRREVEQIKQEKMKFELEVEQLRRQSRPPSAAPDSLRQNAQRHKTKEDADVAAKLTTLQNELAEYRHKEMLLLAFPDPNGPLPYAEPSGDICVDLERQITATELRSQLLQGQAAQLAKSLGKLREAKGGNAPARNTKSEGGPRQAVVNDDHSHESPRGSDRSTNAPHSSHVRLFSKRSSTFVIKPSGEKGGADDVELLQEEEFERDEDVIMKHESRDAASKKSLAGNGNSKNNGNAGQQHQQQPIQLWRVPVHKEGLLETLAKNGEDDAVTAALAAYRNNGNDTVLPKKIGQAETVTPPRSRSNSYGRPDTKQEEVLRQMRSRISQEALNYAGIVEKDKPPPVPSLPSLPSLPSGAKTSSVSSAANSIVSRAMTRQNAIAAELRLKAGLSSAGKQRQQTQQQQPRPANVPPQPPSSPYSHGNSDASSSVALSMGGDHNAYNGGGGGGAGGATSGRLNWDLYSCSRCSKTYSNQRDLDIHSAYCSTSCD